MSFLFPGEDAARDAMATAASVGAQAATALAKQAGTEAGKAADAQLQKTPSTIIAALIPYVVIAGIGYWLYTATTRKR